MAVPDCRPKRTSRSSRSTAGSRSTTPSTSPTWPRPRGRVRGDPREEGVDGLRLGVGRRARRKTSATSRSCSRARPCSSPSSTRRAFRTWAVEFASALMGRPLEFWYDQFLAKPPGKSAPTRWHQDEGYWGRNLDDRGITCWMPLHDVDVTNGCMHFIDGGHRDGVLEHRHGRACRATSCTARPTKPRAVACPLRVGGVTFHHSKTPHMTNANASDRVAAHPDAAPPSRRLRRRGRPLPVEGVRQPVHRRTHHPAHPLKRRRERQHGSSCRVLRSRRLPAGPNELAKPNVDAFVGRAHRRVARARSRAEAARSLPHVARRRDRHAVGHRRSDDRSVRALGLRPAHDRRRRRSRRPAAPGVELRRDLARPRRPAQHRRVPREPRPRAQPALVRRGRLTTDEWFMESLDAWVRTGSVEHDAGCIHDAPAPIESPRGRWRARPAYGRSGRSP